MAEDRPDEVEPNPDVAAPPEVERFHGNELGEIGSADDVAAEAAGADRDVQVPWRVFAFVGVFVGAAAILYGATSKEDAGTAMLVTASILALFCGTFLWRNASRYERGNAERGDGDGAVAASHEEVLYLPTASPWPIGIGAGLALALNGLLIGTWFLVPGVMVLAISLAGFARQSRHRR